MASNLELHSLSTGRKPRVVTVMTMLKQHLFRYQGHIGAYLVVAGCDPTGAHLFTVHAHGSTDKLPYVTMGSGSLAAMSVFETQWKPNMTNVDVCVITKDKTELLRNYLTPNTREPKKRDYKFQRGTTAVLNEKIITKEDISKYVTVQDIGDGEAGTGEKMEVDA
jgi:20S proteasome subunit beta 2